ncbi:MAG: hypothetical protein MKZ70_12810, partial [Opitutales bacterium]|nr:hypothetical protein [Opitutales bacterium]
SNLEEIARADYSLVSHSFCNLLILLTRDSQSNQLKFSHDLFSGGIRKLNLKPPSWRVTEYILHNE